MREREREREREEREREREERERERERERVYNMLSSTLVSEEKTAPLSPPPQKKEK